MVRGEMGWPRVSFGVRRMERERVKRGQSGGALGDFSTGAERKMGKKVGADSSC
jgi:hypothetical protein